MTTPDDKLQVRQVVCAALKVQIVPKIGTDAQYIIITGPRHYGSTMTQIINRIDPNLVVLWDCTVQGFIDQFGFFMDRREAFVVAVNAFQVANDDKVLGVSELHTEDLY